MDEIVYYLQGMQSDIYKQSSTLLNNNTKFVIIPEVSHPQFLESYTTFLSTLQILTELIRSKYSMKYDEAVCMFLQRKLPESF